MNRREFFRPSAGIVAMAALPKMPSVTPERIPPMNVLTTGSFIWEPAKILPQIGVISPLRNGWKRKSWGMTCEPVFGPYGQPVSYFIRWQTVDEEIA